MVAAASVVLKSVKPHTVVAGVPASEIGAPDSDFPSQKMLHNLPRDME